ncbi:hypothetical protein [Amycolatopsis palatopharyngis]|uniref:hypothetical protein n=1 Tax=Amycolatopsis palatopharyngis TaxID=187982 RepID=UPI000E242A07|nr:hypothetical protein [Amycolatopsis palatopharyngis]
MDPRDRADALLSRAQARGGVVTPDNMTSPMDASNTQQIPRSVVRDQDPDSTTQLPASVIEANDHLADSTPTNRLGGRPRSAPQAREPQRMDEVEEQELDGLIPTVTSQPGQSALSRRLDGL